MLILFNQGTLYAYHDVNFKSCFYLADPPPTEAIEVYITGSNGDSDTFLQITNAEGALLGNEHILAEHGATTFSEANAIALSSDQVYIMGTYLGRHSFLQSRALDGTLTQTVKLLTNTSAIALSDTKAYTTTPQPGFFEQYISTLVISPLSSLDNVTTFSLNDIYAYGIALSDSKTYIVGENTANKAVLITTDLDGSNISNPIPLSNTDNSKANAVAYISSNVYIAGTDGTDATLWITDANGTITSTVTLPNEATAKAIALDSNNAYIVGGSHLWIYDYNTQTPTTISLDPELSALGVAISSSKIYIVGRAQNNAVLQITNLDGTNPGNLITISSGEDVSAKASAVAWDGDNSQLYIVGTDGSGNAFLQITNDAGAFIGSKIIIAPYSVESYNPTSIALSSTRSYNILESGTLQITDLNGNLLGGPITIFDQGSAESIALSSSKAYIVGNDSNGSGVLQITDLNGNLLGGPITIFDGGNAESIALSSSKAYIVGQDTNASAVLQIINLDGTLLGAPITLSEVGAALDIALSYDKAYIVGIQGDRLDVNSKGFLQITDLSGNLIGNNILLTQPGHNYRAGAYQIAIYPPGSLLTPSQQLRLTANQVSNVVILRGLK